MAHFFNNDAERGVISRGTRDVQQVIDAKLEAAARDPTATAVVVVSDVLGWKPRIDRAKLPPKLQQRKWQMR